MIEQVRAAGPDSQEAAYLRGVLKDDALGTLMALHQAGRLLARIKVAANKPLPAPSDDWRESADGLIYSSVERSLDPFFATAVFGDLAHRWRPDGAPVQTYFVNKCVFTLKDLYFEEHEKRCPNEIPCSDFFDGDHDNSRLLLCQTSTYEDPEMVAVYGDELRNLRPQLNEKQAGIVLAKSTGRSHKEIGPDFDMTDTAVSSTLRRLRRRIGR